MTYQEPVPPIDTANALLGETPSALTVAMTDTPGGQRLILTVRTPSTTLSVLLNRDDANSWADLIKQQAGQMSGLILAGPGMPTLAANGTPA